MATTTHEWTDGFNTKVNERIESAMEREYSLVKMMSMKVKSAVTILMDMVQHQRFSIKPWCKNIFLLPNSQTKGIVGYFKIELSP